MTGHIAPGRGCFYIPAEQYDAEGWIPSWVTEDEPGHAPLAGDGPEGGRRPWHWGRTYEEARAVCAAENERLGVTPDDAFRIISSSMAAGRTRHHETSHEQENRT
jgi:hypothetical protein